MLSVRSREGLGFGGGGERRRGAVEMEENELEEGEACSGQEDDSCIDPDVALSYIDEKIQDVLGHFQKDFEGGVSAENLGAKFGGYGSFLPTYQRSPPILTQPRSSPMPANHTISRSPCNSAVEGVRQNPPIATIVSLSRNNTSSTARVNNSGTASMTQPNNLSRNENFTSSPSAGRCVPQNDLSSEPVNSSDKKSLKLRLKVGLPKDNAAIYYGLGLDDSPSSSLEDSPDGSTGIFPEFQDAAGESPVTILQVMTCFSVPGGYLLSPLHEHLFHLSERASSLRMSGKPRKGVPEISLAANSTLPTRDLKGSSDKKAKFNEKNGMSPEESLNCKSEASKLLEKEIDIETPAGQKLLSNALNIPVFSNLRNADENVEKQAVAAPVKVTSKMSDIAKDPDKTSIKDKISSTDIQHDDQLAPIESLKSWGLGNSENESTHSKGKLNSKIHLVDKAQERRHVSNYKDSSSDTLREIRSKTQRNDDISKFSYDGCKDTDNIASHTGPIKLVSSQKANSHEKDEEKKFQGLDQVHKGKDKQKPKHDNVNESTKENLRAPSSVVSKEKKKSSHSLGGDHSEKKSKIPKSRKEMSRSRSREPQGELVRIIDDERENMTKLPEPFMFTEERPGIKKDDNIGISEQLANAPIVAPSISSGPTSDAAPALHAPVLIKENWVQCDKCMKWRLLPYGADPDNLPKEWECKMQIWLPGLNSCIISEEETQKAFNELYLVPAPGTGANLSGHHDVAASSITSADAPHIDQRREHTVGNMPTARKKYRPMGTSNLPNHSSSRKNLQAPFKNKRSSDVNEYPRESNSLTKPAGVTSKSTELTTESHKHRQKKNKIPGCYSDGGDSVAKNDKHSKSKSKREVDQDGVRTSKKFKKEVAHVLVEDRFSDLDMACKAAPIVDNGLSSMANGNFLQNYCDQSSSKDTKCETKGNLLASIKRSKDSAHVLPSRQFKEHNRPPAEKSGTPDFAAKKRKLKEWQESKGHQDNVMSSQHISDGRLAVKEAFSESELRKQKKVKAAMPEGKEPSMSDTDGKMDKKGNLTKILLPGSRETPPYRADEEERVTAGKEPMGHYNENVPSRRALDGTDSSKLYGQLPAAATSSSSKVSGSRKTKANIQEVKGSPVESVSSSPLRIPKIEKVSTKSYSGVKDDVVDVGLSLNGSPKRSDGEVDGGSDQSGNQRKETGASGRQRSLGGHRASDSGVVGFLRENCTYQDKEAISGGKVRETLYLKRGKQIDISSAEFVETHLACDTGNAFAQSSNAEGLERGDIHNEDKLQNIQHQNGSTQQKSGKSSSLCSRERNKSSNTNADRIKLKVSDSGGGKKDLYSIKSVNNCQSEDDFNCDENYNYQEDVRGENCKFEEKDENYMGKKNSSMKRPRVNGRGNYSSKEIEDSLDAGNNHTGSKATLAGSSCKSSCQENLQLAPYPTEQLSGFPDRIDRSEMFSGIGISQSVHPSKDKQESRSELHPINVANKSRKPDDQNGKHSHSLRQATPNGHDSASPMRKDGPAAAHVLKEARDLKHTANRLKKEGLEHESIGIFFESALKFLHYASLLEPSGAENARQGELKQMMNMYSETAKLCMYCAHEYERSKEMAAAALAYKCVEVAYMKAAYYKHPGASKDRHELQTALQTSLPGESPSSSASDVDNLNNLGALDKAASTKAVGSPQIAGNYIIAARNRPHFMGLLNYTNDLISAFEATKRSQSTISAASVNLDKVRGDGLSSVREVLDFNYHNVEGLLRLVRRSMALISH